jgi:hypothetical protein
MQLLDDNAVGVGGFVVEIMLQGRPIEEHKN